MIDEMLKQKILFAKQALTALKFAICIICVVVLAGSGYAIHQRRLMGALAGWIVGVLGMGFLFYLFLRIDFWLVVNDVEGAKPLEQIRRELRTKK